MMKELMNKFVTTLLHVANEVADCGVQYSILDIDFDVGKAFVTWRAGVDGCMSSTVCIIEKFGEVVNGCTVQEADKYEKLEFGVKTFNSLEEYQDLHDVQGWADRAKVADENSWEHILPNVFEDVTVYDDENGFLSVKRRNGEQIGAGNYESEEGKAVIKRIKELYQLERPFGYEYEEEEA